MLSSTVAGVTGVAHWGGGPRGGFGGGGKTSDTTGGSSRCRWHGRFWRNTFSDTSFRFKVLLFTDDFPATREQYILHNASRKSSRSSSFFQNTIWIFMIYDAVWQCLDKPWGAALATVVEVLSPGLRWPLAEVHFYNLMSCINIINLHQPKTRTIPRASPSNILLGSNLFSQLHAFLQLLTTGGNEPWNFSVHLCASLISQLGHKFHCQPHQHISDNTMIYNWRDFHLKHSWNITKRNLSVGLQRLQPMFQHPVLCCPRRLLVWQGLPIEAVAPVVVSVVVAKHRTPLADPLVAGGMDASGETLFQTLRSGSKYFSSLMTFRPRESNTLYIHNELPWRTSSSSPFS